MYRFDSSVFDDSGWLCFGGVWFGNARLMPPARTSVLGILGRAGRPDARCRGDQLAFVVEAGEEFDGANDGHRVGLDYGRFWDDARESTSEAAIAMGEQSHGLCVAVEGGASRQMILRGDGRDAVPIEERLLDFIALGMAADAAFARVVGKL